MAKTLSQRADYYLTQYWALRECARFRNGGEDGAEYSHPGFPSGWFEDYGADAIAFDVWTEGPAQYEREAGYRPTAPLDSSRREHARSQGFRFHRDGTVSHDEDPASRFDGRSI